MRIAIPITGALQRLSRCAQTKQNSLMNYILKLLESFSKMIRYAGSLVVMKLAVSASDESRVIGLIHFDAGLNSSKANF